MSMLDEKSIHKLLFPDHGGYLGDSNREVLTVRSVESLQQDLKNAIDTQKNMEFLVNEFVLWANETLLRQVGSVHPFSVSKINRPIVAAYLNDHLDEGTEVIKYSLHWKTRTKPQKMMQISTIYDELVTLRFSVEERWVYKIIEYQRINVMNKVNQVREHLLLVASMLEMVRNASVEIPLQPTWFKEI